MTILAKPSTNPLKNCTSAMLSTFAEVVSGVAKGRQLNGKFLEVPYLRVANVQDGFLDLREIKTIPATPTEIEKYKLVQGDVVLTEGGDHDKLGRGALWNCDLDPCIHQNHIFRVRVDQRKILPMFFVYYLRSMEAKSYFLRCAKKTTNLASINMTQLKALPVPLPTLKVQAEIVEILDQVELLKEKRIQSQLRIQTLTPALFFSMFGHPTSNTKQWPVQTFGSLAHSEDHRRVPLKSIDRAARPGIYPYYGASGIIDKIDDFIFDGSRLLIAEDGANLLSRNLPVAFLADGRYWVNNHAHVFADNGMAQLKYLEQALLLTDLAPYVTGSAQPKLTKANLDRIPIPCPPIELQEKFASICEEITGSKDRVERSLEGHIQLCESIFYKLFANS